MKRYLLFIISMFCVSIGAWAQEPATNGKFGASNTSEWSLADDVLTLTFNNANDIPLGPDQWGNANSSALCDLTGVKKVIVNTGSGVTLSGTAGWGSALHNLNSYYKSVPVLDLSNATISYDNLTGGIKAIHMSANDGTFNNVILPSSFASNITSFRIAGLWGNDEININKYVIANAKTVYAALDKTDGDGLTALTNITSGATTLKIMNEVDAIDLSSVLVPGNTLDLTTITTGSTGSNAITVVSPADPKINVICFIDGVKSRVKPVESCYYPDVSTVITGTISEITTRVTSLASYGLCLEEANVTGELSTANLTYLGTINGLKRLNLQEATLATEVELNSLAIPSTLEELVLPKTGAGETTTPEASIDATLLEKIKERNSLKYVYAPYSGTQDASQMVADYVWVNKPGGLWQAMEKENHLLTAVYVKIACDVAGGVQLNEDDARFGNHKITEQTSYTDDGDDYPWQYVDLSGTSFGVAATNANTAPHAKGYRIILPNNLTGDHMAIFASKPVDKDDSNYGDGSRGYRGSIAAVYSYSGTTLNLMEITDANYHTNALSDSRIVRSGTTAVKIISGSYGGTTYSKFGPKLLAALNGAVNTIKSATIAVGDGIYTSEDAKLTSATRFEFTNTNLTNLTMNYINNSNLTVDVSGCTNLQSLYLNETTLAGVNAENVSGLTTASLGHAIVGGDVNLSGTALTSLLEVDLAQITGTLDVSNSTATSFDFTQLTAKSVNASNANNLTSLDINGITLDNDEAWNVDYESSTATDEQKSAIDALITARTGTVEVTRTSGEYGNLDIIVPKGNFNKYRIVPNATTLGNSVIECENGRGYLDWHAAFKNWLKTNYTLYLQDTETLNTNYDAWATEGWKNAKELESYTGTLENWKALSGNSITDWEELFCESENVVNMTTAKTAFAGTFEAWYSQTYTTDGYLDSSISNDYTDATDKDEYSTEEEWKAAHYADKDDGNYKYVTTAATTAWDASPSPKSTPEPTCGSTYTTSEIEEAHVELTVTVAGNTLSDNIGNIWLDTDGNFTADVNPTPSEIEILHVTGTITTDDLDYIAGMTGLKTLDLSEATGVTYSDIINAGLSTKTAIILPGTTNNEDDMVTAMNAFQTAGYECVGYYTAKSETSKKLNVYGYNGTVANLKTGNITTQINATGQGATGTMVEQPKLIDTDTDLTFLPVYGNTTASVPYQSTDNISYPQATPSLLTAFRENFNGTNDYPYSVDMSWLDISNLGVDFSGVKCRHLVIPQNTMAETTTRNNVVYHNDFTDETADAVVEGTQHRYYKYNDMVYAVSTYKSNNSPYGLQAYYDGKGILFTNGYGGLDETATLTYLRSAGQEHLNDVVSHMSPLLQGANVIMLKGTLTEDIAGLNALTNDRIDLTRATITSMSGFDNDNVKYLALPDGMNDAIAATSADDFAFSDCEALKAVGAYDPTNTKYTVHSTAKTVTFTDDTKKACSDQEASVFEITKMCAPNASRQAGSALGTTNIVMSGYLMLSDIQMDGADAKAGLNTNSSGSVVTADFSNAVFMDNNDMCFTAATWNGKALTSILLPTDERQNTIPARSLYNYSALTEICIPYNYEHIGNAAFYLANLGHLTTTDKNGALVDNGNHTFTFSKNLKTIGEAPSPATTDGYPTAMAEPVFFSYAYHSLTDVYVLRTGYEDGGEFNPTKCYRNAFGAGPTYGWGGFDGGNVYCREKYMNGDQLFTVLHFPDKASVSNDENKYNNVKKTYTDPTKVYTKKDQTGAVDANGESPLWPTFAELCRSYNQAVRGLIWEDWTYTEANQKAGNIEGNVITATPGNPTDVSRKENEDHYDFTNYVGWHEFVLSLATYVAPDEKVDEDNKIYRQYEKDKNWYTFCIPFDMTEAEVIQLLGVPKATKNIVTTLNDLETDPDGKVTNGESITPNETALLPEIRTIKSVTRNASTTTVSILTSEDLATGAYRNKYWNPSPSTQKYEDNGYLKTVNSSGVATDSDVPRMLRAGYPYLIKPYKLKGTTIGNLGKKVVTRYAFAMAASAIYHDDCWDEFSTSKFARPYEGHKIQAQEDSEDGKPLKHTDDKHKDKPYNYTFVGQFWEQPMPLHSFYQNSKQVWKHYQNYNAAYKWYPYICIITVTDEVKSDEETKEGKTLKGGGFRNEMTTQYPNLQGTDQKGHDVFDHDLKIVYKNGLDDPFNTASTRGYNFVFDEDIMDFDPDGNTTAIEVLDGQRIAPVRGKVYNMAGQYVGNSLEGLSKGMYIVNGKKVVVD